MIQNRRKDDVLIGRMEERVDGLVYSFRTHETADHERFELVFSHMKDRFDKIDAKLETLWDTNNKNQGAFGASRLVASGVWATVVLAASWFINRGGA